MKKTLLALLLLSLCSGSALAQDTLRVMAYNLLYYGQPNDFCDRNCKDEQLRQILADERLDIFAVNEISNAGRQADNNSNALLNNVLNINGVESWQRAPVATNTAHNPLNALYYNSDKLGYIRYQTAVSGFPRLDLHKLYYKSNDLETTEDTVFLHVAVFHHKAGSSSAEERQRGEDVATFINLLDQWGGITNLMVLGDFNCQGSDDAGYAPLLEWDNPLGQLRDPINRPGRWNENAQFASIHTQSTRTTNEPDGGSNGGSDDRLDIILCSAAIMERSDRMQYVNGTYRTVGQDGSFLNGSMLQSSSPLRNALYRMSDHMPVGLELIVDAVPASLTPKAAPQRLTARLWPNPVAESTLHLEIGQHAGDLTYRVVDLLGRQHLAGVLTGGTISVDGLQTGVYFVELQDGKGNRRSLRFIRQ